VDEDAQRAKKRGKQGGRAAEGAAPQPEGAKPGGVASPDGAAKPDAVPTTPGPP
jgi:hypothetical protein